MGKKLLRKDDVIKFATKHASAVRFLLIGSVNTLIDLSLYALLANIVGISPVVSSLFSTGITLCFSYLMNHYFVFKSERKKRHTVVLFFAITLFNVWVIQSSVIYLALRAFDSVSFFIAHQWTLNMFAKLCGVAVSMVLNYLGYRTIFDKKQLMGDL